MNNSDLTLDGSTATWTMPPMQGEYQGTYMGTFRFKCYLTPMQSLAANKEYRELLGAHGANASEHDGQLSFALTQLKHRVISSPPFWEQPKQNGEMAGSIPDIGVILAVLDAAIRAEMAFKEKMVKERDLTLKRTITIAEEMLATESEEET